MLTKSLVLEQLRCPKALWLSLHDPDRRTPSNAFVQRLKAEGQAVGVLARGRYPGGVLIEVDPWNPDEAERRTREAMEQDVPAIFEATFLAGGVLVRVDLLVRDGAGWAIVEVKASTKFKKGDHVPDIAVQWWVLERAGVSLRSASLMHVRSDAKRATPDELFATRDITPKVLAAQPGIEEGVGLAKRVSARASAPHMPLGRYCEKPRVCDYYESCVAARPLPERSVFDLPRIGAKKWDYLQSGIADLQRIPEEELNEAQQHARKVVLSGKRFVDREALAAGIVAWGYPMLHLDFETCSWAIPPFEDLAPYAQVPVQYSLHVELNATDEPQHFEYLHDGSGDPRPELAEALAGHMRPFLTGDASVTAYSMAVERGGLRLLAESSPASSDCLLDAAERLVDPLPLLRNSVYDEGFRGSFSIKSVAPVLLGEAYDYDRLRIHHGAEAMARYDQLRGQAIAPEARESIRADLLEYCAQDTRAMLELVRWIRREAGVSPD